MLVSLVDIKRSIVLYLKKLNINILANEIRSGFEKPAFFVQLMPVTEESNNEINFNIISVYIHYFSDDKTDLDNIKMLDKLRKLFKTYLNVSDRSLTIYDKSYEINDNVLQFKFNFKFTDTYDLEEEYEKMEDLIIDLSKKKEGCVKNGTSKY